MFISNDFNYKYIKFKNPTKKKITLSNIEWSRTQTVKKIIQYNSKDEKLNEFYTMEEAAKFIGVDNSNVSRVLSGKKKTISSYKLKWEIKEEEHSTIPQKLPNTTKKIIQYTIDNEFVKEYSSMRQAAKELEVSASNISRAIKK